MNKISFRNDILPLKDKLYRLAMRITLNERDAEDIVQDTLIKVWNRRERWDELESIEAFSLTVCRNLALDSIKRKGHGNPSIEDTHAEKPDLTANPYEEMLQNDRVQLVRDIINALPEKQKTSMQLREFEGKSYREIAQIMEITEEQVKINIFRARQTIKQKFKNVEDYGSAIGTARLLWKRKVSCVRFSHRKTFQPSYANTSRSSLTNNWRRKRSIWAPTSTIDCWP